MTGLETGYSALAGFSALCGAASYATFRPRCGWWGRVLWRGNPTSNGVALTFDDGPTAPYTKQILDILRRKNACATFFVVGENAKQHPELLRRMRDEGHTLGNHTFSHPHYGWLHGPRFWRREIERTDQAITDAVGEAPKFFRPPLGFKTPIILREARHQMKEPVAWSCRAYDGLRNPPEVIRDRLLRARPGDILLLHDGVTRLNPKHDPTPTVLALPSVIDALRAKGLEILPLKKLI